MSLIMPLRSLRPFSSSFPLFVRRVRVGGGTAASLHVASEVDERKQHEQSGQLWPQNVSGGLYLQKNERKMRGSVHRLLNSIRYSQKKKKKRFLFSFCVCGERPAWNSECHHLRCASPDFIPVFRYLRQQLITRGRFCSDQSACFQHTPVHEDICSPSQLPRGLSQRNYPRHPTSGWLLILVFCIWIHFHSFFFCCLRVSSVWIAWWLFANCL